MATVQEISAEEANALLARTEGHFFDFKAKEIEPSKLTRTFSAFANSEGGEVCIGIEDPEKPDPRWQGYTKEEDANSHLAILEKYFPEGDVFSYRFLRSEDFVGLVLYCEIFKNQNIWKDSKGDIYIRKGAQNLRQDTFDSQERLKFNKGIASFEDRRTDLSTEELAQSDSLKSFLDTVVPRALPEAWLSKQKVAREGVATVAGAILFSDEPQIVLPKAAIKIARYRTSDEPTRATLEGQPVTIDGCAVDQITSAVDKIVEIVERLPVMKETGLKAVQYPRNAIHEIITNAVIHRDYSVNDDVHVRVFDNRIEIFSPGPLPAHVTIANILDERFARNQKIVRLGSGLIDQSQKMTVAAMQMADMKVCAQRS